MAFYEEDIEKLFDKKKFKELGIVGKGKQEAHLERLANHLFYLNNRIAALLMPYVVKLEYQIKALTDKPDFKSAIKSISKNSEELLQKKKSWVFAKDPRSISSTKDQYTEFLQLLELHRFGRNKLMHGTPWIGRYLDISSEGKLDKTTMINEEWIDDDLRDLLHNKNFNYIGANITMHQPSFLSVTFILLSFFNHVKLLTKLAADVDMEIFSFHATHGITNSKKFYDWLGLRPNWVKRLIKT